MVRRNIKLKALPSGAGDVQVGEFSGAQNIEY